MTTIVHVVTADAAVGDVVVDDIVALDGEHRHLLISRPELVTDAQRTALGDRLLTTVAPAAQMGWRDVRALDDLRRALREQTVRSGRVIIHAHGARARGFAAVAAGDSVVIVDAADEVAAHRLVPPPGRTVYASHGDLDRALDAGAQARYATIAPPGIERAEASVAGDVVVIADDAVGPHVHTAFERQGLAVSTRLTADIIVTSRQVIVGPRTHLGPGIATAIAAGIPTLIVGSPWADDVAACAAALIRDHFDLDEAITLASSAKRFRPRRLPKALGRAERTAALAELYDSVAGPSLLQRDVNLRQRHRRRHR